MAIIKIKIEVKTFIESLPKPEDGSIQLDEGLISCYLVDILNDAGVAAEAQYQDIDWSISIQGKKYFTQVTSSDDPEMAILWSCRYFADEVNSDTDYEAWYSYSKKEHFLNLRMKDPKETQESQPEEKS